MARGMIAKFDKYRRDIPGVMVVAVVLDPSSLDHSFDMFGGDEEFELYKNQAVSIINKSELDRYLDEQVENNSPDFDILSGWKGGIPEDELYATIDEEEPLTSGAIGRRLGCAEWAWSDGISDLVRVGLASPDWLGSGCNWIWLGALSRPNSQPVETHRLT
ncbi:hypothetical protein Ddye_005634 [Dipteronia dyeriana]|uniref:Uncharacterized protein n=1 Tax=Dipteronia dyeriana TaxID=168575 RepID=A0AAD9XGG1_9ROSI|nr:hypothetical protein Ddye_005634 [Dipteronia dyeriana]